MVTVNILWALTSERNVPAARSIHQAFNVVFKCTYLHSE